MENPAFCAGFLFASALRSDRKRPKADRLSKASTPAYQRVDSPVTAKLATARLTKVDRLRLKATVRAWIKN
jgi:hypothetical protein